MRFYNVTMITPGPHLIKSCYDSNSCWNVNVHWKSKSGSRIFTVVMVADIPAKVAIISTFYEMGPRYNRKRT